MSIRFAAGFLAVLVGGCATLQGPPLAPSAPELRLLLGKAEADLRRLVQELQDPVSVVAVADAAASVEAARGALAAEALVGGAGYALGTAVERAALGGALTLCADGVARLAAMPRGDAAAYARGGFSVGCLWPLGVLAGR